MRTKSSLELKHHLPQSVVAVSYALPYCDSATTFRVSGVISKWWTVKACQDTLPLEEGNPCVCWLTSFHFTAKHWHRSHCKKKLEPILRLKIFHVLLCLFTTVFLSEISLKLSRFVFMGKYPDIITDKNRCCYDSKCTYHTRDSCLARATLVGLISSSSAKEQDSFLYQRAETTKAEYLPNAGCIWLPLSFHSLDSVIWEPK